MDFSGKSVIVTGAGKGIGRATANFLAVRGAHVIAIGRTKADLDALSADIGCRTLVADVADPQALRSVMEAAGTSDFLVNNAGVNILESMFDVTEQSYETVLGTNLRGALIACQEF